MQRERERATWRYGEIAMGERAVCASLRSSGYRLREGWTSAVAPSRSPPPSLRVARSCAANFPHGPLSHARAAVPPYPTSPPGRERPSFIRRQLARPPACALRATLATAGFSLINGPKRIFVINDCLYPTSRLRIAREPYSSRMRPCAFSESLEKNQRMFCTFRSLRFIFPKEGNAHT